MKVSVKVNVVVHAEDFDSPPLDSLPEAERIRLDASRRLDSYPLSFHLGGISTVADREDELRLVKSIRSHIQKSLGLLSITEL